MVRPATIGSRPAKKWASAGTGPPASGRGVPSPGVVPRWIALGCPVPPGAPLKTLLVVVAGLPKGPDECGLCHDAALIHSRRSTDLAPSVARGEVLVEVT